MSEEWLDRIEQEMNGLSDKLVPSNDIITTYTITLFTEGDIHKITFVDTFNQSVTFDLECGSFDYFYKIFTDAISALHLAEHLKKITEEGEEEDES